MELEQTEPKRRRTGKPVPLYRDDGKMVPTATEGTSFLYLATARPENNLLSGQWEVAVPFTHLDQA